MVWLTYSKYKIKSLDSVFFTIVAFKSIVNTFSLLVIFNKIDIFSVYRKKEKEII